MQKRDNTPGILDPGTWDFWGGHCEEGEDAKVCAIRELKEEIDLHISNPNELEFVTSRNFVHRDKKYEEHVFAFFLDSSEKPKVSEGEGCEWLSLKEMEKLPLSRGVQEILKQGVVGSQKQ